MDIIDDINVNGKTYKLNYLHLANLPDLSHINEFIRFDQLSDEVSDHDTNPVTSLAVYNALQQLSLEGANVTVDKTIESGSVNPVCGDAVYQAIENLYAAIDTVSEQMHSDLNTQTASLGNKVDKVDGKGLSTNDFTDTYKNILDRSSPGLLKVPQTGDNGKIPYIHNGSWMYVTIDNLFESAENGSF